MYLTDLKDEYLHTARNLWNLKTRLRDEIHRLFNLASRDGVITVEQYLDTFEDTLDTGKTHLSLEEVMNLQYHSLSLLGKPK